jgi:hypothetical protein
LNFSYKREAISLRQIVGQLEKLVITHNFAPSAFPLFALKGRWKLAGGEATGSRIISYCAPAGALDELP